MKWFWGYKYGTAKCPECGMEEAINARGHMGRHRRFLKQTPPALSYLTPCDGSGKRPNAAGQGAANINRRRTDVPVVRGELRCH